jgi:hypothetical protein
MSTDTGKFMNTSSADFIILFSKFKNLQEISSMTAVLRGIRMLIKIIINNLASFKEELKLDSTLCLTKVASCSTYSVWAKS